MQVSHFFRFRYIAYLLAVITTMTSLSTTYAQDSFAKGDLKCYVVVGAFRLEGNAKRYIGYLSARNISTDYKKNTHRSLYYVYSFDSKDREKAKQRLFKVRKDYPDLTESWLYAGNFKGPHIPSEKWEAMMAPPLKETVAEIIQDNPVVQEEATTIQIPEKKEPEVIPEPKPTIQLEANESLFYINAYNAGTLKEISGNFKIWDGERNKEIFDLNTHELTVVQHPNNATNRIKIISDIFGFREQGYALDLDDPLADSEGEVELLGDTIILNFDMLRFNKGDVMTLWQVYFYRDAAIMKEESVMELNQLFGLMKENDKVKIKIHGHTNGNSHGKVLHLDLDDKNFFNLNGTHQEATASAKKLSEYRAYTIQHWLMDQGINENRMEIEGWGGKKMIYPKHDSKAHKNVRVEIEILEE